MRSKLRQRSFAHPWNRGGANVAGTVVEEDAEEDQDDRQQEVTEHNAWVEFRSRDDHPQHDLSKKAKDDESNEQLQVSSTSSGSDPRRDDRDDGEPREHAIPELDRRVKAGLVELAVHLAGRPVRTTKTRARQSHRCARHGDDHQPYQSEASPEDEWSTPDHRCRKLLGRSGHVHNDTPDGLGRNVPDAPTMAK